MSSSLSSTDPDIRMRSATPPISSTLSQAAQESTSATPPLASVCAVARDIGLDPFASSAEASPVCKPFRHDLEIQDSDSDLGDDSSNDSDGFMPLTELLNKGTTAMTPAQPKTSVPTKQTPYTAPCAKRQLTKAMFARAQMSAQKNAEFSVEALLADAAQDIATGALLRESALNYAKKERQQKMREESQLSEASSEGGGLDYPECSNGDWNSNLKETLRTVAQDNENDAPDVDKVLAADADLMASTAVRMAYMATIKAVFENLDETQLNLFAVSIATTLIKNFQSISIRHGILRAIPNVHLNLAELRRRLAIAFLHDDATFAGRIPYTFFGLEEAGKLLDSPSLLIHKDTDYLRLCNTIALLDIAIDDGCIPPIPGSLQYDETSGKGLLQDFNSDIDAVVGKLEALARSINDVRLGSIHSTDAKDHINILINRLRYTVRYGGALRVSIYDKILDDASKKPQQWSKLVKSGQAKERGQTAITAFTKTVAKPSPVSPIHDSVESREPDSVFGEQNLASITENNAQDHVPSTPRKKASQRRRSAVPQTPTTSRRTRSQSTALGSSPVRNAEQTPRRSVRILASASKARDGPLRVAVEKQPVH
ncbi:hypothetical protein CFO_g2834 [Ceratocystis platani]|uniref:Uncharacterized protein n=1 Tax=Ceratocystis fimbriata f. sp. platani TaxID=88771 RepID=A0A0F8B3T9_CERFI|nr:hypothetical protein CFO_g2834 [Ceratocystis platani]